MQLIQAGKPLSEKCRFILFEDKREVELVRNGKTREGCSTVLPFQSLEHVDEPRKDPEGPQLDLFDLRGRQIKVSKGKKGVMTGRSSPGNGRTGWTTGPR